MASDISATQIPLNGVRRTLAEGADAKAPASARAREQAPFASGELFAAGPDGSWGSLVLLRGVFFFFLGGGFGLWWFGVFGFVCGCFFSPTGRDGYVNHTGEARARIKVFERTSEEQSTTSRPISEPLC